jgi:hypothetical protein
MPGGLIQLVSYGSQNIYLNGNPSISFFKKVYKTHTNFATESIRLNFNKTEMSFRDKTHIYAKLDRNGDLINNIYFAFTLPAIKKRGLNTFSFVENLGEAAIEEYYIYIGGNVIDKQYGEWLHIWNELALDQNKRYGYERMTGNVPAMYRPDQHNSIKDGQVQIEETKIVVPLMFWFNAMPGLSLPLIALQYHDIEIHIILRPLKDLCIENSLKLQDHSLYFNSDNLHIDPYLECNYVFLDTEERGFFAKNSLDYLIQQVRRFDFMNLNEHNILELPLQNPVKELIWVIGRSDRDINNAWFRYCDKNYIIPASGGYAEREESKEVLLGAKLIFNGLDRFDTKDATYFNIIQPYQHHTVVPKQGVYVYSFSLNPEKFQPSGACNMSRINGIQMHLNVIKPSTDDYSYECSVFATNYNFLRVTSGLGGVAFAC